jgi:serine/threonine-protein kinase RIM15
MLMRDRDTGSPTHTMWVIKPVQSSRPDQDAESDSTDREGHEASQPAITLDTDGILSSKTLLCRICEREVPTWFFEKHNETCNEVHRLEADISAVNERLSELRRTVTETKRDLETPGSSAAYQGIVITPRPKTESDYRHGQVALAVQKIHQAFLEQVLGILTEAYQISTPTISEETANMPIRYQTLLSPTSEERLSRIGRWQKPNTNQPALQALFQDVDDLIRAKQRSVNRMRNTIVYSERVRQEWEDRVNRLLAIEEETSEGSVSSAGEASDDAKETVRNIGTSSPGGADVIRDVDPHARLPVTLGRQQSQPAPPVMSRSASQASPAASTDLYGGATESVHTDHFPMTANRRVSGSKTPMEGPLSPRLPPVAISRKQATSIKDFDIIKPISRGAFGSVFLAKKRTTGDYYAIKALRKQDMIAKNQITNVKAERTILMDQANSPYVAKLFWSFQSREYLYLVMEYLNGGDCASLIRTLGGLPEEWVKCYIAEVVLGLEYMHDRGIVHR